MDQHARHHRRIGEPGFDPARSGSLRLAATPRPWRGRQRVAVDGQAGPHASVALVTGGGRGVGRLLARSLAGTGAAVGLVARSGDELAETVRMIEAAGGVAASAVADVGDAAATGDAISHLRHRLGPIEPLVNNAGVSGPSGPAWEVDPDRWWRTVDVNLRGTFNCAGLVLPEMVARGRGRIVNITSHAGVFRWPTVSAYSVSKAAVVKFTENLAYETRAYGISVFGVHPGLLPIGLSESALAVAPENAHEARVSAWIRRQLDEGRGADPGRAADLVVRLASGRYDELAGRQLSVDDDLDEVLARIDEVRDRDLYVLGLQRLATMLSEGVSRCR
jgi:NAD(P)-dependent dehydrogenase (short-subunit alcohol dehydrogenase family)